MHKLLLCGVLLLMLSCTQPKGPKEPIALEKLALEISEIVEPGFTLRKEKSPATIWVEMRRLRANAAFVSPDSMAVGLGMIGFPRSYVYYYRLVDETDAWNSKVKRLRLKRVGERWYWRPCSLDSYDITYPC